MAQTDNPNPKMQLPEAWGERMACPVCGGRPLGVFHPTGQADRFACGSCATSFELEDAGKRLRFIILPKGVTPWMRGQWVVLEEALAAFEVFKSEQGVLTIEGQGDESAVTQSGPLAEPHEPTPEELKMRPPSKPDADTQPKPYEPTPEEIRMRPPSNLEMDDQPKPHEPTPEEIKMRPPSKPEMDEQAVFESRVKEEATGYVNNALLFDTDKGKVPVSSPLPFYEDDFVQTGPVYVGEIKTGGDAEVKAIESEKKPEKKPESEKDVWKNSEEERVVAALVNPPEGDFAGHLAKKETAILPDENEAPKPPPVIEEAKPQTPAAVSIPTIPVVPAQSRWSPETSTATRSPVEYPAVENPPPAKPAKGIPPVIKKSPERPTAPIHVTEQEDLGTIRSHISGAMLAPTTDDRILDAMERAVELQKLGNTDQEVRSILERSSGLTPEQVSQVLQNLEKPEERKRSNNVLFIFLAIALLFFAIFAFWFFNNQSFATPSDQTPGTAETKSSGLLPGTIIDAESLPEQIRTYLPNGLTLFNEQPSVEQSTEAKIPAANCPNSNAAAAALFGGPAKDWKQDSTNNGWTLTSTAQKIQIKIPANMKGGYLIFERGPEMRSVIGPAIVKNIYMIAISCG